MMSCTRVKPLSLERIFVNPVLLLSSRENDSLPGQRRIQPGPASDTPSLLCEAYRAALLWHGGFLASRCDVEPAGPLVLSVERRQDLSRCTGTFRAWTTRWSLRGRLVPRRTPEAGSRPNTTRKPRATSTSASAPSASRSPIICKTPHDSRFIGHLPIRKTWGYETRECL